jgi:hypothetical protein
LFTPAAATAWLQERGSFLELLRVWRRLQCDPLNRVPGRSRPDAEETFFMNDNDNTQTSRLFLDQEDLEYLLEGIGRLNPRGRRLLNELAYELKHLRPDTRIEIWCADHEGDRSPTEGVGQSND